MKSKKTDRVDEDLGIALLVLSGGKIFPKVKKQVPSDGETEDSKIALNYLKHSKFCGPPTQEYRSGDTYPLLTGDKYSNKQNLGGKIK